MAATMWALRWLAAACIFANCVVMTLDAAWQSASIDSTQPKTLVTQLLEVR
ncbi:MAG: hypothetical protein QOF78_1565 [Phycisphaerales bacterium]|jgi:hypothetical protein|nr:hypothetical protein [Phycisphaerales bacterium]MEA2733595.1 hypothetical protein [Humisphaera sp.]